MNMPKKEGDDAEAAVAKDESWAKEFSVQFIDTYCDKLIALRKMITELAGKQEPIVDEIVEENRRLSDKTMRCELSELQAVVKMYQHRLITLKREMNSLQERSTNLKERARKLRQNAVTATVKRPNNGP